MKKILFGISFLCLLNACGPSEEEINMNNGKEIETAKESIDNYFDLVMNDYYSANEDFDKNSAIYKIKLFKNSQHKEIVDYAQKHIDSLPKLKESLKELIYGELFEFAKLQGWDKLAKSDFLKIENSLKVKGDEFSNSELYRHPSSPKYINQNGFFLYYQKAYDDNPKLVLKTQYYGDDWLFINKAEVSIDGEVYSLNFEEWDHDNSGGMIYEWSIEQSPSYNQIVKIIKSKSSKIRYHGDKYYDDRTISSSQKAALKSILQAYYGLYLKK